MKAFKEKCVKNPNYVNPLGFVKEFILLLRLQMFTSVHSPPTEHKKCLTGPDFFFSPTSCFQNLLSRSQRQDIKEAILFPYHSSSESGIQMFIT